MTLRFSSGRQGDLVTLVAGTQLGPYQIVAPLGAGGMGEVYRARDSRLNREVAIKVLPSSFAADEDRLSRFRQEALATSPEINMLLLPTASVSSSPRRLRRLADLQLAL